ncbi:hypothetical protein PFICI_12417 [Pestalotiopsis fici W106-1]|uniref:Uncharacterized protein n=1 Tax=Pestalotiopsis fici (strain W106-1 / CGMCC3.15140) TaxID=1229662 RepID=W3WNN6_PESFW|nr:uncharacterized protein PFICI_12417 [Pestalotiopsis fici W106-1]ETS75473.1 hypothetical protein PFICI_12417 [Pestalotiopsis fici W106-1]
MEHIIQTFMRVQRQVDDADSLIARYPELERLALSNPAAISDRDRRRLLDIPDQDVENTNLAAVTQLSKAQLLERAAKSPNALTDAEIDLLMGRYWRNVSSKEALAGDRAREAMDLGTHAYSRGQWEDLTKRLTMAREPLYEQNELEAFQNAPKEWTWRMTADTRAREAKEIESAMRNAAPWIQRLWTEDLKDRPEARWGYAIFRDPAIKAEKGEELYENYLCREDGVLVWARWALRCGSVIESRFQRQRLEWPVDLPSMGQTATEGTPDINTTKIFTVKLPPQRPCSPALLDTFQRLREAFHSARAAPRKSSRQHGPGINDNLLSNVFLVVDQDAANSIISRWTPSVDDMWVWAVDPDFAPDSASSSGEAEGKTEGYQGYLRVRIQQLVKNFYEARRWHADKISMQTLWEAAQVSRNQLFVSINEEEAKQWKLSRDTGIRLLPVVARGGNLGIANASLLIVLAEKLVNKSQGI